MAAATVNDALTARVAELETSMTALVRHRHRRSSARENLQRQIVQLTAVIDLEVTSKQHNAETAIVARPGVRGPSTATRSPMACAVLSPPPLSSSARPSSAYYVTNGPRRAGTTPSSTPTSTSGADAWRRIALQLSTT